MKKVTKTEQRTLKIGDEVLQYCLERKAIKRMNLRVRQEGDIYVSAPMRVSLAVIERFLASKLDWIKGAQARVLARQGGLLTLADGEALPIEGVLHTVRGVKAKKQGALRQDGVLILQVHNPADLDERRRVLEKFFKAEAIRVLTERVKAIHPLFERPVALPSLSFRAMKSRWGSCTASKLHITLNTNLLFVPPHLADYVILHEYCHFKHQNHSAAFYAHLATYCPDYVEKRAALRAFPLPKWEH